MKKNMGLVDRLIRVVVALAIGFFIYNGTIAGTLAIVLGVLAAVFLLTSLVAFCPLYLPIKLNTGAKE